MRVLLINPPVRDFYNTPPRRQPLGLLYLAGALRGHEVSLIDAGASRRSKRVNPLSNMNILAGDASDSSPFKLFGRFYHFGPGFEEIIEKIKSFDPQVIGISSLFNAYAEEALACAQAAREAAPGAAVVLGGGYPSSRPGAALDHHAVDFTVAGEGEQAFSSLVDCLDRGGDPNAIPGVSSRDGVKAPAFVERIDELPRPARELLDLDAYRYEGRRMALILSSRGCPFECAFCSAHLTTGRTFRPRSPEEVVKEMLDCRERFGVEAFDFEDDNLALDPQRAQELMTRIIETFGEDEVRLHAMNGISMKGLSSRLLDLMRRAGFRNINLSPLSIHPVTRCAMARPEKLDDAISIPEQAAAAGLKVTAYVMIGFPGQQMTEIMADIDTWSRKPVLMAPSVFYPAPGSAVQRDLFPLLDDAGPGEWGLTRSSLFPEVPGGLSRRELRTAFWMTRLANFARSVKGKIEMEGTSSIRSEKPLDAAERGVAAAARYLVTGRPHGIRLKRKGEYELFALEEMIDDPAFYARYGIPGIGPGIMERLRRRA